MKISIYPLHPRHLRAIVRCQNTIVLIEHG